MEASFSLFDGCTHIVQRKSRPQFAEIPDHYLKFASSRPLKRALGESTSQCLVHYVAERTIEPARLRLKLRRDIFIQGEGGSHALMLYGRHHDVKAIGVCRGASFEFYSSTWGGSVSTYFFQSSSSTYNSRNFVGRNSVIPTMIHFFSDFSSRRASRSAETMMMGANGSSGILWYQPTCLKRRRYHGSGQ